MAQAMARAPERGRLDAEADIGASSPHAEPFRVAADELRRSFKESYREPDLTRPTGARTTRMGASRGNDPR
jgi:hypothetical protein